MHTKYFGIVFFFYALLIAVLMHDFNSENFVLMFLNYNFLFRVPVLDSNINGHLLHHKSGPSENGRLSRRSSSGSLDLVADGGVAVAEHPTGIEETGWNGLRMPETDKGFVNSNDRPKTKTLKTVNNRESFKMEAQHKFVNNNKDGLNVENQLEDADDEFD